MKRWFRRQVAVGTVVVMMSLCLLGWGGAAYGGEAAGTGAAAPKGARITLEQAIGVVKEFIKIPEDFQDFQPGYSEGEQQGIFWELQWSGSEPDGGNLHARVNAQTGELWSMNIWKPSSPADTPSGLPKLSRAEAQVKAWDFLKKALPNYINNLEMMPDETEVVPYLNLRGGSEPVHYFNFVRMVNGIPYQDNNANVEIDSTTGELRGYYFNWDSKLQFPEARGMISADRATDLWRQNAGVRLAYYRPRESEKDAKVKLVFEVKNRGMMIDARSGEIIKPEEYGDYGLEVGGAGGNDLRMSKAADLTPAEQRSLTEMEKLISRENALKIATDMIEIPAGYNLENSNLQQEYFSGQRIWNFNWQNKEDQTQINVRLEAKQGQVIGFSQYGPYRETTGEPRFNEAQAREIVTKFLNKIAGKYTGELEELRAIPEPGPYPVLKSGKEKPKPVRFNFTAERLVNGIPFRGNGTQIGFDAVTGKITEFRLNWWDLKFPEARGTISKERAENAFLADDALILCYQREYSKYGPAQEEPPVRLVYALNMRKAPSFVDPLTGLGLDSEFMPKSGTKQVFSDLTGHRAAEAVNLLAKAKIIPIYESSFRPDAQLSQRDFLIWVVRAAGWRPSPASDPDQEFEKICRQAIRAGILKSGEKYLPQEEICKLTLTRLTVRALGWDEPARLKGVWLLPSEVAKLVPDSEQGYLALAAGRGVFNLNAEDFDPGAGLTRAEGALILYQLLK